MLESKQNIGFFKWTILGEGFSISIEEIGDYEYDLKVKEGPSGKQTINKILLIDIGKKYLPVLKAILDRYNSYEMKNTPRVRASKD